MPLTVAVAGLLLGLGALVASSLAAGGAPAGLPPGMSDPGPVVGWGVRVVRLAEVVLAVLVVAPLLVAVWLAPGDQPLGRRCLRAAGRAASAWAAASAIGYVLVVCDLDGVPLLGQTPGRLLRGAATTSAVAQLAEVAAAATIALAAATSARRPRPRLLLAVALVGAIAVPVAGHASGADDRWAAVGGAAVHVVAALVWLGGLVGLLRLRARRTTLRLAAGRFSPLALACYVVLAGSGLLVATDAVPVTADAWRTSLASGYVALLAVKALVLAGLGVLGALHRSRSLPRLAQGAPRAFLRLALAELGLMAVAAGLAVALARTPLPVVPATTHAGAMAPVGAPTPGGVLLAWRPDALVLVAVLAAVTAYVAAVRRLRDGGVAWPARRTGCFVGGAVLAGLVLCSAVAVYARVLLSVHLFQLVVLLLVVPLLLLLGRPLALGRLASAAAGTRRTWRLPGDAGPGAVATCLLLSALVHTPLLALSLGSSGWHLLVAAAALGCGLALLAPLVGEGGAGPAAASSGWLLPVALALVAAGARLLVDDHVVAAGWFLELRLGWVDLLADQRRAGVVLLAAGAGCAGAVLAAVVRGRSTSVIA